jgi:surface protein
MPQMTIVYKISSAGKNKLLNGLFDLSNVGSITINGSNVDVSYTAELSIGEHEVVFTFSSSTINLSYMLHWITIATKVDLSGLSGARIIGSQNVFSYSSKITSINLGEKLDTSSVTSFSSMFADCAALTHLDVSALDTRNCTNLAWMFRNCSKLKTIEGLENFDTSKVTSMESVFCGCNDLLDFSFLSFFNTAKVTTMYGIFSGCYNLKDASLLSGWDVSKVGNFIEAFYGCTGLVELRLYSEILGSARFDDMFGCSYASLPSGIFYHKGQSNYDKIVAVLPSNWTAVQVS